MHHVPKEFLQLSANAAESRKRTESLYSSATTSELLPIKLLVGNHIQSDSTSCVHDGTAGMHQMNGNCDIADDHVIASSSQAHAVKASHNDARRLSDSEGDPRVIPVSSESVSRGNGEVEKYKGGCDDPQTAGPFRQLSDNSLVLNGVAAQNNDLVLIAAGHEVTMMQQQKQCKDDKRCKPQTHFCSDSTVKPQAKLDASRNYSPSVSEGHSQQTHCLTSGTTAKTGEGSMVDQSVNIKGRLKGRHRDSRLRQPHSSSSDATVVPACLTNVDEYHPASHDTSSSASVQSDSDVASTPAEFSPTSPNGDCDVIMPPYSSHAASRPECFAVSPSRSDLGEGDTPGQSQPHRCNSIGRGQILRMMLTGSQH